MKINEIKAAVAHRPWPIPQRPWQYYQEWNETVFLHWAVAPALLRDFVPQEIPLDILDGKAWVSVVAFSMEKIRPRFLPGFPPISNFLELNVRTYVRANGKTAVYFLSLEADNAFSCWMARTFSRLPYRYARMNRQPGHFSSQNPRNEQFEISFEVGEEVQEKTKEDLFLTERYALFQEVGPRIHEFEIHHIDWPLRQLAIKDLRLDYPRYAPLLQGSPQRMAYSTGVQVLTWGGNKFKPFRLGKRFHRFPGIACRAIHI
jgi:uncharacterized protein YqjF (DUF2071 family)